MYLRKKNQIGNDRVKKFCRSKIVQQFGNDLEEASLRFSKQEMWRK